MDILDKLNNHHLTITPNEKKKTMEQFFQYLELSSLLFDSNKDEIYNVTDIPVKNKFYKIAKHTAKELGIDWKGMSHENSNRIMLSMLEESFNLIRDIENSPNIIIKTHIQILKK